MKKTFLYLLLILSSCVFSPQNFLNVIKVEDNLWVDQEHFPTCINFETISQIHTLITQNCEECLEDTTESPLVIIRFLPLTNTSPFPYGSEGFAGMVGKAYCRYIDLDTSSQERIILLSEQPTASGNWQEAIIVIVKLQVDPQETIGNLIHELSHTNGSIDGCRCPAHPDFNPHANLPVDHCDAYWWYGPSDFWMTQMGGIVNEAFNNNCESSDEPETCIQFKQVFDAIEWGQCGIE